MDIKLIKGSLKSIAYTIIIVLILLFVFNFISYSNTDPDKLLIPLAYTALIISTFVCGFLSARFCNDKRIMCSAISGAVYIFLIFILSIIIKGGAESSTPGWLTFIMYVAAMGNVVLGSLAGKPRKVSSVKTRKNIKNKYTSNLRRKT